MRIIQFLTGLFGAGKNDRREVKNHADDSNQHNSSGDAGRNHMKVDPIPGPRKNFGVPTLVPVERPVGPVLVPCNGDGGVQGLGWYAERLRIDEDGDIADEFIHEVMPETSRVRQDKQKPFPRFQENKNVPYAKVSQSDFGTRGEGSALCVISR